jgi:hypothetical protein
MLAKMLEEMKPTKSGIAGGFFAVQGTLSEVREAAELADPGDLTEGGTIWGLAKKYAS